MNPKTIKKKKKKVNKDPGKIGLNNTFITVVINQMQTIKHRSYIKFFCKFYK